MGSSVELKPTTEGYKNMLTMIVECSSNEEDIAWAKEELAKLPE